MREELAKLALQRSTFIGAVALFNTPAGSQVSVSPR